MLVCHGLGRDAWDCSHQTHALHTCASSMAEPASDFVLAKDRLSHNASEVSRATRREVCLLFFVTSITAFINSA